MSSKRYRLVIIGGGPAGLMAGIEAAYMGMEVIVLEKNDRPGKKLLATGGGQCNLTHHLPVKKMMGYYHEKGHYAGKALRQYPPKTLMEWFEHVGVELETTQEGKVFPASRKAVDVLQALVSELNRLGIMLQCETTVLQVIRQDNVFKVVTNRQRIDAEYLLIATGGASYPSLGTTGDGYRLAERLGHRIKTPRPALAAAIIDSYSMAELAGITIKDAHLTHWRDGSKKSVLRDDLLITHEGLSGPVILNHSRNFMHGDILSLNFMAPMAPEQWSASLTNQASVAGKVRVGSLINRENLPRRLVDHILDKAEIGYGQTCAVLSREQRRRLVKMLTAYPFFIQQVKGFDDAMVTAGGVSTNEVNGSTMASRLIPDLYFAGEVLDVDGMTGGFNLQYAFSSGVAAARAICQVEKIKSDGGESFCAEAGQIHR